MQVRPTGNALALGRARFHFGEGIARGAGLVLTALLLAACSSSHGASSSSAPSKATPTINDSYGSLPTFLPTPSGQADSRLTGSPDHPAVTSEGDEVLARITGGTVQVQVTGPVVPGEGLPKVTSATTCTWTVTLDRATTSVPIRLADFVPVDEDGHSYQVEFVPGATRPPAVLRPGLRTTFELRVVMATGEGVMRWQPDGHALAVWDFVVEND